MSVAVVVVVIPSIHSMLNEKRKIRPAADYLPNGSQKEIQTTITTTFASYAATQSHKCAYKKPHLNKIPATPPTD